MSNGGSPPPTRREPPGAGGADGQPPAGDVGRIPTTVREGDGQALGTTALEGPPSGQQASGGSAPTSREQPVDPAHGWVPVPLSLQERYQYVGQVASSGGEANLYRVRSVEHPDRDLLLKLYLGSVQLDPDALEAIGSMRRKDVVQVVDNGRVSETGYWYEVQEYLSHGDLLSLLETHSVPRGEHRSLHPRMVREILGQLQGALNAFHRAVGPHHDLKPSNVLVRTPPPDLQIALADFGLAVATDRSVIYQSRRAGTIAYDSPESLGAGQGGSSRDWWALGMTIAHLAGGRHPFEHHATGTLLTDAAIRDHLHNRRPIDLDAVTDPDLNTLCQGLTRYTPDHRWGPEEIAAWRRGHPVPVVNEQPAATPQPRLQASSAGIDFAGHRHTTRSSLAHALANDWRAAAGKLGNAAARQQFVDDIAGTFGGHRLEQLDADWARQTTSVDRAIAELVVALDPTLPPTVAGWEVSQQQLAGLVRTSLAADQDSEAAGKLIDSLYNNHLLAVLAHLDGQQELWETNRQWHQAIDDLKGYLDQAGSQRLRPGPGAQHTGRTLLAATVEVGFFQQLVQQRDQALRDYPEARNHPSVSPLVEGADPTPAQVLATTLLAAPAATQIREQRAREEEQKRQKQREIDERRSARARQERLARQEAAEKQMRTLRRGSLVGIGGAATAILATIVIGLSGGAEPVNFLFHAALVHRPTSWVASNALLILAVAVPLLVMQIIAYQRSNGWEIQDDSLVTLGRMTSLGGGVGYLVIAGPVLFYVGRFVLGIAVFLLILWVLLQAATD